MKITESQLGFGIFFVLAGLSSVIFPNMIETVGVLYMISFLILLSGSITLTFFLFKGFFDMVNMDKKVRLWESEFRIKQMEEKIK